MVGITVHYWQPNHPDHHFRSNVNRTILLVRIGERFVPIGEKGVKEYNTIGLGGGDDLAVAVAAPLEVADEVCCVEGDGGDGKGVANDAQPSVAEEDVAATVAIV